ncbi:MAG: carboxypeptidase-like regulatory domain-containing protein [Acidobacteria bacterium]|nr:carboxypeptidase-like regulatory domain-containing protein [Acidobacteriota bacterium]
MRSKIIFAMMLTVLGGGAAAAEESKDGMKVSGSVLDASAPVDQAVVLALNLTNYDILQTRTDHRGTFSIDSIPTGIYRIIAVKRGFAPAIATIVPNRVTHSILLKLKPESMLSEQEKEEIWAIRRAIPSDVLRELEIDAEDPIEDDRFSGRMMSLAGLEQGDSGLRYSRATVGLTSRFDDWTVSLDGNLRTVDESAYGVSLAESSGVSMTVRSSPEQSYSISTNRGRWLQSAHDDSSPMEVEFEAHRLQWNRADSHVEVRYTNHDNLFLGQNGSERIELVGETNVFESGRSTLDVGVRLGQFSETHAGDGSATLRTAQISADASHKIGEVLEIGYGIGSRYSDLGSEWVPRSSAEIKLGSRHSVVVSGMYKVYHDQQEVVRLPALIFIDEQDSTYPRYRYSVGVVADGADDSRLSAIASVAAIDSLVRIVFDDRFDQFWDGLFLDEGDVHHDVTLRWNGAITKRVAVQFSSSAGWADPQTQNDEKKVYLTGTLQSLYRPSGTSLDIAYRYIEQPWLEGSFSETERLAFRMGQNLRLPLNLHLLFGFDVARDENPILQRLDLGDDTLQTRLVGGLSVAF